MCGCYTSKKNPVELAEEFDTTLRTIRFYEDKGLIISRRTSGRLGDLELLLKVLGAVLVVSRFLLRQCQSVSHVRFVPLFVFRRVVHSTSVTFPKVRAVV